MQMNKYQDKGEAVLTGVSYSVRNKNLLNNLSLRINLNKPTFVVGYNGAGKSLLLKVLIGYINNLQGTIEYTRPEIINAPGKLAYSSQQTVLLSRSVFDNVAYVIEKSIDANARKKRVVDALTFTNLTSQAQLNAHALSGGERQRLALARAIASDSELLVLDEPTANLDPGATRRFEEILCQLQVNTALIMVSHDLAQIKRLAQNMCGNVCFMDEGYCLEVTNALQFLQQPQTEKAQAFLKSHSFW